MPSSLPPPAQAASPRSGGLAIALLLAAGCAGAPPAPAPNLAPASTQAPASSAPASEPPSPASSQSAEAETGSSPSRPPSAKAGLGSGGLQHPFWRNILPSPSPRGASPQPSWDPTGAAVSLQPLALSGEDAQNAAALSNVATRTTYNVSLLTGEAQAAGSIFPAFPNFPFGDWHVGLRAWEASQLRGYRPARSYSLQQATEVPQVGSVRKFYVLTALDNGGYRDQQVQAQLLTLGQRCYVFVDEAALAKPLQAETLRERAAAIGAAFDGQIHPTNTRLFGAEPNPGVDGDPRIYILISPAVDDNGRNGVLGYFSRRDQYPADPNGPAVLRNSNAKEMLNISSHVVLNGSADDYLGTVAHEFEHMINFNQKVLLGGLPEGEEVWADEGLAMYALEANGFGLKQGGRVLSAHVKSYQASPGAYSLVDWDRNPGGIGYGPVYLFMVYLADRFGEGFLRQIVSSPHSGVANIDALLQAEGTDFAAVFRDWAIANVADIKGQPRYGYRTINMRGATGATQLSGFSRKSAGAEGAYAVTLRPFTLTLFDLPPGASMPPLRLSPPENKQVLPSLALP